jgi:hypothetical protein
VNTERRPQRRRPAPRRLPDRWGLDRPERRRRSIDDEPREGRLATPRRRLIAVLIGLTLLGGTVAIATMSAAGTRRGQPAAANCTTAPAPATTAVPATEDPPATETADGETADEGAAAEGAAAEGAAAEAPVAANDIHQHDGANVTGQGVAGQSNRRRGSSATCTPTGSPTANPPVVQPDSPGESCDNSDLPLHDGFQNGNRCVSTDRGEVPLAENAPSLLIVSSPFRVRVNQPFEIRISTRNLIRDFFLPAGAGGYFKTRDFLNEEGITHGHAHTSIIPLSTTRSAPDVSPVPVFFLATEDGKGGKTPDTFVVRVPGIATPGLYKITSWCGAASHAVPMAQRANQTPCVDSVRLVVTRR